MNALNKLAYFIRPYRWFAIGGIITVILPVMMELVVPRALQYMIDDGIRAGDMQVVWRGAAFMFGAAFVGAVTAFVQGWCRAQLSQGLSFDLRNALFAHIQSLSFANLDQMPTGRLMTRVSSDVDTLRMFASANLALILRTSLMVVGSLIMLLWTNWQLAMIVVVLLAVASIVMRVLIRVSQPLFSKVQLQLGTLNTVIQENLAGIQVVKAFVRERFAFDQFQEANAEYTDQNIWVGRLLATGMPILMILTNIGVAAILWFGGTSVIDGHMSVGELVAFNNYLMLGMAPLLFLSNLLTMAARAESSAERVLEVMETKPTIQETQGVAHRGKMHGRVTFENVSFRYPRGDESSFGKSPQPMTSKRTLPTSNGGSQSISPSTVLESSVPAGQMNGNRGQPNGQVIAPQRAMNGEQPLVTVDANVQQEVLASVSFSVEPGEQVALLGATGSGKSSLVQLIPRFYDVLAGSIRIDDVDVREWAVHDLRSQVSTVMQQPLLFSGTVRENIAYGRPNASLDEVVRAAQAAQAHDFITARPDGYDDHIEAHGTNLSGGQRQRIAIARALLTAPSILILDDSTSAVDFETEIKIQDALNQIMKECTTFVIAQRISSVLNADKILVLNEGQIVAQGTHHELMASSTLYREIYDSQMGEEA